MSPRPDLNSIFEKAKQRGYFLLSDCAGLTLNPADLAELLRRVEKAKIPLGAPSPAVLPALDQSNAEKVVRSLRRGIPAADFVDYYSAGRDEILKTVAGDLASVANGESLVRFINADVGQGKTHFLYLLRELAFKQDFAVSLVTLSQNSCPLHDFMSVYHGIMWGLRTSDQRQQPALSNIFDRWIEDVRPQGVARVTQIIQALPDSLRAIMGSYAEAINIFRPDEVKRQAILKYLSGERTLKRDIAYLQLPFQITSDNALQILSHMALAIRHIGFKGICILFDEAEAIHSFATSTQRDCAFANLRQIIQESRTFPHCYFVYATTPSFFAAGGSRWVSTQLGKKNTLELDALTLPDRYAIGERVAKIYAAATTWVVPDAMMTVIRGVADRTQEERIGDYIRAVIAVLDEKRPSHD